MAEKGLVRNLPKGRPVLMVDFLGLAPGGCTPKLQEVRLFFVTERKQGVSMVQRV
jgi:hypothetical protein